MIAIAILLFVLAAFAGPRGGAPTVTPSAPPASVAPGSSVAPGASATPSTLASAGATATPSSAASPTPQPTGSPVATVDQIVVESIGDYMLADRNVSETGIDSGALGSVELRYVLPGGDEDTDIFHAIEIHPDDVAAQERVETFGAAMEQTGYEVLREQSLRNDDGSVQGYFISLRGGGQLLLLWSNRNATFSLGGGPDADVNAFYESLPY